MSITPSMLSIQGHVFESENIIYANSRSRVDARTGEWQSLCRNSTLISTVPLSDWIIVFSSKTAKVAFDFVSNLLKVGNSVGFKIEKPTIVEIRDDSRQSFLDALQKNCQPEKTQCVVCVFPNLNKDRYDSIKNLCSVKLAIPSQCVVQKYAYKLNAS